MGIPRFREYGCEIQAFLGSLGLMQAFLGLGHPQIRETRLLMATLEDMKSVASSSNRGIAAAGIALNSKAADVRERLDRVQVFALGLAAMGAADKAQNGHIANATRSSHGRNLTVGLLRPWLQPQWRRPLPKSPRGSTGCADRCSRDNSSRHQAGGSAEGPVEVEVWRLATAPAHRHISVRFESMTLGHARCRPTDGNRSCCGHLADEIAT